MIFLCISIINTVFTKEKIFHRGVPVGFVGTVQLVATAAEDSEVVAENLLLAVAVVVAVASVESFAESLVPERDK